MRAALVVVVTLTGCQWVFSPSTDPDGTAADAPPTDLADADPFAPDADPLAPDAAPCAGLFDEDGDGTPDGCDVCPHVGDEQLDGDGDGVGDACDPHPAAAVDQLTQFVGFNGSPLGWQFDGTWMVGSGRLVGNGEAGSTARYRRTLPIAGEGAFEAELQLPMANQVLIAGIEIQRDASPLGASLLCVVEDEGNREPQIKVYELQQDRILVDRTEIAPTQPRGAPFRLRAGYQDLGSGPRAFCAHNGVEVGFTPPSSIDPVLGGIGYVLTKVEDAPVFESPWGVLITQP
jgi:hypothetical protein